MKQARFIPIKLRLKAWTALAGWCVMLLCPAGLCATLRVDGTLGNDGSDGSAWGLAKKTIPAAINAAGATEVWVKAGTYVGTISMKTGVAVYAGFAGTENFLFERNYKTNATILDGGGVGPVVSFSTTSNCRLDGFTVQGGVATNDGGGLYLNNAAATTVVANCTITGNQAMRYGGGLYLLSGSPMISNCVISGNRALDGGGANFDLGSAALINSIVSGNSCTRSGGGIYAFRLGNSARLMNCSIISNVAGTMGGGVFLEGPQTPLIQNTLFEGNNGYGIAEDDAGADPIVVSCLFDNNAPADYRDESVTPLTGATAINNIPGNSGSVAGNPLFIPSEGGVWSASPVYPAGGNQTLFTDASAIHTSGSLAGRLINVNSVSQKFQSRITDNTATEIYVFGDLSALAGLGDPYVVLDYHPQSVSPAVNAGAASGAPLSDLDGALRPSGLGFDIGAFEHQFPIPNAARQWTVYE